jgi:hypothetical protein
MDMSATKMQDTLKSPASSSCQESSLLPRLRRAAARRSTVVDMAAAARVWRCGGCVLLQLLRACTQGL